MSHTTCDCTQAARDAETDIWPNPSAGQLLAAAIAKAADGMGLTSSLLARPGPSEPADASEALRDVPPAERPSEALPRPIDPEDVRVGMVVERRKGDMAHRDRVQQIDGGLIDGSPGWPYLWVPEQEDGDWSLWLVEDAPQVDEDAALVEVMAEAVWRSVCGPHAQWPDGPGSPSDSDHWRESSRAAIVAARAAGYRIEADR